MATMIPSAAVVPIVPVFTRTPGPSRAPNGKGGRDAAV